MKFMIIGGLTENKSEVERSKLEGYCIKLGRELRRLGHSLNICSPYKDSADYWVFKGYVENDLQLKGVVDFYFVDAENIRNEIDNLRLDNISGCHINKIPSAPPNSDIEGSMKYSWLLCQLKALESCQMIISIGGKLNGSANMLLLLAEEKGKFVLPFTFMDGVANQTFYRRVYEIKDRLGKKSSLLQDEDRFYEILSCCDGIYQDKNNYKEKNLNFFISYARARPYEADYIENILRRRGLKVFRDETDFGAGCEIPGQIKENIYAANVFIAVWCAEYACSPWCYDEIELALDRNSEHKMELWIICVDDTRIIPKRARKLNYYTVTSREEIEGTIFKLLNQGGVGGE